MAKTKTKSKVEAKAENLEKCYSPGESFWINRLTPTTAEVRNNCLNGLCVGDIIEILDDNPNEKPKYVRVLQKKVEALCFRYTFDGLDKVDGKFPEPIQKFIHKIEKKGIRFEGVVKGMAILSRPLTMPTPEFLETINDGPITWTAIED